MCRWVREFCFFKYEWSKERLQRVDLRLRVICIRTRDYLMPAYTPYWGMKLGKVRLVSYEKPGSEELFSEFSRRTGKENGYLLAHHGPVAGGDSLMDAFFNLEELEESARIAWELRGEGAANRINN